MFNDETNNRTHENKPVEQRSLQHFTLSTHKPDAYARKRFVRRASAYTHTPDPRRLHATTTGKREEILHTNSHTYVQHGVPQSTRFYNTYKSSTTPIRVPQHTQRFHDMEDQTKKNAAISPLTPPHRTTYKVPQHKIGFHDVQGVSRHERPQNRRFAIILRLTPPHNIPGSKYPTTNKRDSQPGFTTNHGRSNKY